MKKTLMPRRLPYDFVDGILLGLVLLTFVVPGIWLLVFYPGWPDVVATHYNFAGEVDGWGGKSTYLILYAVDCGVLLLIVGLNHFPRTWNQPGWLTENNVWATARFLRRFMEGVAVYCGVLFLPFFVMAPELSNGVGVAVVVLAVLGGPLSLGVYFIGSRHLRM